MTTGVVNIKQVKILYRTKQLIRRFQFYQIAMSLEWFRAWLNTPQLDCGLCGRPTCAAFVRSFFGGDLALTDCPVLQLFEYTNLRTSLEAMYESSDFPQVHKAAELPENGILMVRPCTDDDTRVSAEAWMNNGIPCGELERFGGFDSIVLCDLLGCAKDYFESIKCSEQLGYARLDRGEVNITILRDGRINMRKLANRLEVERNFAFLERLLFGALICDCCGCDFLSILVDNGRVIGNRLHPIFQGGWNISLNREFALQPLRKELVNRYCGNHSSAIVTAIEEVRERIKNRLGALLNRVADEEKILSGNMDVPCLPLDLFRVGKQPYAETILLKAIGILRKGKNALDGIAELSLRFQKLEPTESNEVCTLLHNLLEDSTVPIHVDSRQSEMVYALANVSRIQNFLILMNHWDD